MTTYVFIIAEDHRRDREGVKRLRDEVVDSGTAVIGYEAYCYLFTTDVAKQAGVYGIDDWIFGFFAKIMMIFDSIKEGNATGIKGWIKSCLDFYKTYKNYVSYYESNKVSIKNAIEKLDKLYVEGNWNSLFEETLDSLSSLSELVYQHPDFSPILVDQEKREYFKLKFNLNSMQELFNGWKEDGQIDQQVYEDMRVEIVWSLRNISMGENIKKIIEIAKIQEKNAIFAVGTFHAACISEYIESDDVNVIQCEGYDEYEEKKTCVEFGEIFNAFSP